MSTHLTHRNHPNALAAFHAGQDGLFGKREREILTALKGWGPQTDREIMLRLEYTDMNAVRPRCTELVASGVLEECGSKECPVTGKTVRIVRIKADPRLPARQFTFDDIAAVAHQMREDLRNQKPAPMMMGTLPAGPTREQLMAAIKG